MKVDYGAELKGMAMDLGGQFLNQGGNYLGSKVSQSGFGKSNFGNSLIKGFTGAISGGGESASPFSKLASSFTSGFGQSFTGGDPNDPLSKLGSSLGGFTGSRLNSGIASAGAPPKKPTNTNQPT